MGMRAQPEKCILGQTKMYEDSDKGAYRRLLDGGVQLVYQITSDPTATLFQDTL